MPEEFVSVPLGMIDPFVNQSREHFDPEEIRQLADDIAANGQLQPGVAMFDGGRGRYGLICGERRLRALALAGIDTMLLKLVPGPLSLGQMVQMNLAENIQRASLNPIERAKGFRRLMQVEKLTASEVATRLNTSNATVSRETSLLELPEDLQARVADGSLPVSVGSLIVRLPDDDTRRDLLEKYAAGRITRDGIAAEVKEKTKPDKASGKPPRLAWTLGGIAISVSSAKPDRLTCEAFLGVLSTLSRAAKALKEKGQSDLAELADVLNADRPAKPVVAPMAEA